MYHHGCTICRYICRSGTECHPHTGLLQDEEVGRSRWCVGHPFCRTGDPHSSCCFLGNSALPAHMWRKLLSGGWKKEYLLEYPNTSIPQKYVLLWSSSYHYFPQSNKICLWNFLREMARFLSSRIYIYIYIYRYHQVFITIICVLLHVYYFAKWFKDVLRIQ